ncbi:MAG: cupin domain-containing protein, partial [Alphaproteobacteria bacterium]|nr:cupin domain-containing protein [Alphaproteobacteria bacterium]
SEAVQHHRVYKPWGNYEQINKGNRFQVKFVMLKPGAVLEMQTHLHRSEHWVVVSGTARVNCQDKTYLLSENESTYIPLGSLHSLENPGMVPLKMIQVLSGEYLGEDDVVLKEEQDADPHFSLTHQKKQA